MAAKEFMDRTIFPGSHSLQVRIEDRVSMPKKMFIQMTQSPSLKKWLKSDKKTELALSIPPSTGEVTLPQPAKLIFTNGQVKGETVYSDLRIFIFRRSDDRDLTEETISAHVMEDFLPLAKICNRLFTSPPDIFNTILATTIINLLHFYNVVDPTLMHPVLKQRLFDLDTRDYLGHICANCSKVGSTFQCSCRSGVYYCCKDCQKADWASHKALVPHAKK